MEAADAWVVAEAVADDACDVPEVDSRAISCAEVDVVAGGCICAADEAVGATKVLETKVSGGGETGKGISAGGRAAARWSSVDASKACR